MNRYYDPYFDQYYYYEESPVPVKPSLATRLSTRISELEKELKPLYERLGKLVVENDLSAIAIRNLSNEIKAKKIVLDELKALV
jgi:hypothetical protein